MPFNELVVYILFVVGFALTPGPNMMLCLTYTFESGRRAGWATAAGIVTAFVVHIGAIIFGLTALFLATPYALEVLRYCGIVYLFYLAIRNLKMMPWKNPQDGGESTGLREFYIKGLIGNLLNPGSLFLYFSLIPQFIHPARGHILEQNLFLGGIQMLFSFITNCTIVFLAGYVSETFFRNEKYQQWLRYIMSFLIILFAFKMLVTKFN